MENMTNFEKYGNVMIDLETLSTNKNASIIEIGAVEFNKHTGETGKVFNALIKPSEWTKNDRHVDGDTIAWWFKQKEEARERFFTENENIRCTDLKTALNALFYFIMDCDTVDDDKNVTVWETAQVLTLQYWRVHMNILISKHLGNIMQSMTFAQ